MIIIGTNLAHSKTIWAEVAARHGVDLVEHPHYDPFGGYFDDAATNSALKAAHAEYLTAIASTPKDEADRKIAAYAAHNHARSVYNAANGYKAFAAWAAKRADGDDSDWSVWDMEFATQAMIDAELARLLAKVVSTAAL